MSISCEEAALIREALERIKKDIPEGVTLLAATKTVSAEKINYAHSLGIGTIGENRVNELLEKYDQLDKDIDVQFIGHLQSNKVKYIIDKVSLIHSLDSETLAKEIDRQAKKHGRIMDVLVEINIGNEESKSGIAPEDAEEFIKKMSAYENIFVKGLMAIPPVCNTPKEAEKYFKKIREIFIDIRQKKADTIIEGNNISMDILSMGMSGDYKEAIKCGSTMVRIGSAIFGARNYAV
ncbi:MAG: YggS family pyridoxal phosphate-dependent enzyme [Clostridia bacterium]|nr:YggS family pyridoxal phosphate-dependent enzyme [Clostridia bacterium]